MWLTMSIGKLIGWLRGKREAETLPDELWQATLDSLPFLVSFLARLSDEEKARLRALVEDFLAEKEFTSAGGLELTDAMCVSIAVQGCLPILNLGLDYYRDWVGVIVYPDEFVIPRSVEDEFGVVHEYDDIASGEAWEGGPLLISWQDAQMAGDGYNVVIHEFAHQLDQEKGHANGAPDLVDAQRYPRWARVLGQEYGLLQARLANQEATLLDPYAATDPAEFFAVSSEVFFEQPHHLAAHHPELYGELSRYYRIDPRSW